MKDIREEPQLYHLWNKYTNDSRYIGNIDFRVVLDTVEEVVEELDVH